MTSADVALKTFTALLGLGVLLHEIQLGATPWGPHALVVIAAVIALTHPGIPALIGLFSMLGLELLVDLPNPYNHTFVMGVVGGGVALWWLVSRNAEWRTDALAFLARVGPLVRVTVLLTWALAFFAKLNHEFLETPHSCAIWILDNVPLVTVPDEASMGVVVATLVVEAGVPLLLLLPPTRLLGIATAWGFHVVAAIGGHTAFSAIALPLYLLFLSPGHIQAGVQWAQERVPRPDVVAAAARRPTTGVLLVVAVLGGMAVIQSLPAPWQGRGHRFVPTLLFLPLAAVYAAAVIAGLRRYGTAPASTGAGAVSLGLRGVASTLVVLTILLNAASPYIGLKTGWSLTMYSNLRTEPGHWNHLVIPEQARVFGWQDELVLVHDADSDIRRELGLGAISSSALVPRLNVLRAAATNPNALVKVDGESPWVPVGSLAQGEFTIVHDRLARLRAVPLTPQCQV
jgi:hypothetical protein